DAASPEFSAYFIAVPVGQHHIQQNDIPGFFTAAPQGIFAISGELGFVAVPFQIFLKASGNVLFVFDDQNAGHAQSFLGNSIVNVLPVLGVLSKRSTPPWSLTMSCTIARPIPVPLM